MVATVSRSLLEVAGNAVRILGAAGVSKGVVAERLLRNAWTGYSCDFTGDVLRLGLADAL
jgi:alkylation response protein AidB-like acyl-CoA dehydrogenase